MAFSDSFTPEAGSSTYTMSNLKSGDSVKIRFLTEVTSGYSLWGEEDGEVKVYRAKTEEEIDKSKAGYYRGKKNKVKQFIVAIVWNYTSGQFEVFETDKAQIIKKLWTMDQDQDLGDLRKYDIKVSKTGTGMETRYEALPLGASKLADDIKRQFSELSYNLENVFNDENPISGAKSSSEDDFDVDEIADEMEAGF